MARRGSAALENGRGNRPRWARLWQEPRRDRCAAIEWDGKALAAGAYMGRAAGRPTARTAWQGVGRKAGTSHRPCRGADVGRAAPTTVSHPVCSWASTSPLPCRRKAFLRLASMQRLAAVLRSFWPWGPAAGRLHRAFLGFFDHSPVSGGAGADRRFARRRSPGQLPELLVLLPGWMSFCAALTAALLERSSWPLEADGLLGRTFCRTSWVAAWWAVWPRWARRSAQASAWQPQRGAALRSVATGMFDDAPRPPIEIESRRSWRS